MKRTILVVLLILASLIVMGCQKKQNKITLTFNQTIENAPKVEAIKVEKGSIIEEPLYVEEHEEDGIEYKFLGWYNGVVKYDFNEPLEDNVVLNARWAISNRVTALLTNLSADAEVFYYTHISIIKIVSFEKTIIIKDDSSATSSLFDTFSKYKISNEHLLFGNLLYDYAVVVGGESSPNIVKFYHWNLLNFELPTEGDYYLIINNFYTDDIQFKHNLIDHAMKKLSTYNPTKELYEQDEATLSIIQPYIDRIQRDNNK